jgi:peptide/nickel transport system permease protein
MVKSPNRSLWILAAILTLLFLVSLVPSLVTSREAMKSGYTPGLSPPSRDFLLGTDQLGRDIFVWVIHGTRVALYVGSACTAICFAIALIGMFAGYFGGKVDQIVMRITDLTMSIPRFVLIVVFATLLGSSFINIILIIGTLSWPSLARIMRAETLSLKEREFILSARVTGTHPLNIILTEIFPNILPAVIPAMALQFSHAIIDEISISFLGLGDPNVASWGRLIAVGKQAIFAGGWWVLLSPILACVFMLVCLTLLADRLNDRFNPKLRYGNK